MLNRYLTMMHFAIPFLVCLCSLNGLEASAKDSAADAGFQAQPIELRNGDVKLAGSLLLPTSDVPVPAVIFVHGAGPQTRESYREVGEHFASQGIASPIYDKRGTGQSGGVYESYAPYENLVNDAIAGVGFLKQRSEIAPSQIGMWGLSQGACISAAAASRSADIRKYGLSDTLRDVAEKTQLGADTLFFYLRDESLFSTFAPRT